MKPKTSPGTIGSHIMPRTAKELIGAMVRPYAGKSAWFFGLTLVGTLAWTASPVVIAAIVNHLGETSGVDSTIWRLIIIFAALRIADEVFWRIAEIVMRSYKPQMIESVRARLFAATLRRPYSFFVNASSGKIGHWINQTTATVNDFVDTTIWTVWSRVISLIISAIFLFMAHWSLAAVFIVWLVLLFWFNAKRGKKFSKLIALQSEETSTASGMVVDSLSNHVSVRVFNAQARERHSLGTQQHMIVRRWRDSWWQNIVTNTVKGQSAAIVSIVALILVIVLYGKGQVLLGDIVLFIAYFGDASSSLWQLAWAFDSYFRQFGTIQNALDGLKGTDEREVIDKKSMARSLPDSVTLELSNVSFCYPDQPSTDVVKDVSLSVSHGKKLGIVGHSGAGKSTLVGLLLGFYEPSSGHIRINSIDTTKHDPSFIRSVCSFVPQDSSLFNRSIRENVLYSRPDVSDNELDDALRLAQAYEFVAALPKGVDTIIGERGVKLSGGQRQRIAIARAILQNAPLLILDEATSALDSVSEQSIQKALHELMKNRTSVVIAHRLSTIKHLDCIIVLDKGSVIEQGTHDELIARDGIYADLWKRQKDGFIVD